MNEEQREAHIARYRKTKNYQRDLERVKAGKSIRKFIELRGRAKKRYSDQGGIFIENPVITDLREQGSLKADE
jgi:hypothetical protein